MLLVPNVLATLSNTNSNYRPPIQLDRLSIPAFKLVNVTNGKRIQELQLFFVGFYICFSCIIFS